MNQTLQ